jgi:Glycosyltransferase like family
MIAFGCSIIMPEVYERRAKVGIELAAEPDSQIYTHAACGSVARSFNLMLDRAAALDDLEALVLLHEDVEIVDRDFCAKLRRALEDSQVAVVGCVGARDVRDIAWWDGSVTWTSATYHYGELGGGQLLWTRDGGEAVRAPGEVDSVYGVVLVLSPWVVRSLRFDESIGILHGYDFDICRQARAAGRKVVTADLKVAHHHSLDLVTEVEIWVAAHMRAAEEWDTPGSSSDAPADGWKRRARRAEADAAAARLLAASELLYADASAQYYSNQIEEMVGSRSWRITEPLRRANAFLRTGRKRLFKSYSRQ